MSISASIDLPLTLHARHRTTRGGTDWLPRTLENIRLLARYPHAKKISATLSAEHLATCRRWWTTSGSSTASWVST